VLHKHGDLLYQGVKQTTIELFQPMVERLQKCPDEDILKRMNELWKQVKLCIIMIKDILMYMDRNYVPKMKLPSMDQLQTSQFKHHVVLQPQIRNKLISMLLSQIDSERNGHMVEVSQLRQAIQMLVELSSGMAAGGVVQNKRLYEVEFEKPFIAET